MAIVIAIIIVLIGLIAASQLSEGKSEKGKYIIWGITIMLAIAPFLSFLIGVIYGIMVRSSWVTFLMYLFPLMFVIGLIVLLMGIFKKNEF